MCAEMLGVVLGLDGIVDPVLEAVVGDLALGAPTHGHEGDAVDGVVDVVAEEFSSAARPPRSGPVPNCAGHLSATTRKTPGAAPAPREQAPRRQRRRRTCPARRVLGKLATLHDDVVGDRQSGRAQPGDGHGLGVEPRLDDHDVARIDHMRGPLNGPPRGCRGQPGGAVAAIRTIDLESRGHEPRRKCAAREQASHDRRNFHKPNRDACASRLSHASRKS